MCLSTLSEEIARKPRPTCRAGMNRASPYYCDSIYRLQQFHIKTGVTKNGNYDIIGVEWRAENDIDGIEKADYAVSLS